MKTYYIVEKRTARGRPEWKAYKRGLFTTFNRYCESNEVSGISSMRSADDCEQELRRKLACKGFKPLVIRTLQL